MTPEALVLHDAEVLLPVVVEQFGDTPEVQARRLAELEAEITHQDRTVRRRSKEAFLARQAVAA